MSFLLWKLPRVMFKKSSRNAFLSHSAWTSRGVATVWWSMAWRRCIYESPSAQPSEQRRTFPDATCCQCFRSSDPIPIDPLDQAKAADLSLTSPTRHGRGHRDAIVAAPRLPSPPGRSARLGRHRIAAGAPFAVQRAPAVPGQPARPDGRGRRGGRARRWPRRPRGIRHRTPQLPARRRPCLRLLRSVAASLASEKMSVSTEIQANKQSISEYTSDPNSSSFFYRVPST